MDNILNDKDVILDRFNPPAIAQNIANRMKRIRLQLNLTQVRLSKMSGVSLGSLKRFENSYKISLEHLLQLALSLDALEGFDHLFSKSDYQSIDDVVKKQKLKERKRARNA